MVVAVNHEQAYYTADMLRSDLMRIVRERIGVHEVFVARVAEEILQGLREQLGGREVYIPAPDKAERDERIRAAFNGRNAREVCARYGVSRTRLYQIIAVR